MSKIPWSAARIVTLACVAVAALAACTSAATPPPDPSPSPETPTAPQPAPAAWSTSLGSESWSQPAVDGDAVFVAANDGEIRRLDLESGAVEWTASTGGAIRAGLTVVDGTLYASSDDGAVYAFDEDGAQVWRTDIGNASEQRSDYDNYGSAPRVVDGSLYVGSRDGSLYALDPATGAVRWASATSGSIRTTPAFGDGRVYVENEANRAYAFDAQTGAMVWEFPLPGVGTTHAAFIDGVVILGSRGAFVTAVDAATGETLWGSSYGSSWVQSGGVDAGGGVVAVGSSDLGVVRAWHVDTGEQAWNARTGGWPWAVPVVADGVLFQSVTRLDYQPPTDQAFYAIDASTGAVLWYALAGAALEWAPSGYPAFGVTASPAIADGRVIVVGLDGVVSAYDR